MDALMFMVLSLILVLRVQSNKSETEHVSTLAEVEIDDTERVAKLNDLFYEDENAFSEIINALGFPKEDI